MQKRTTRYKINLAYRGTDFVGWQIQPNGVSIQSELETAFATILQRNVSVVGCGRTDAGVHARSYVAHVDADNMPNDALLRLNKLLPAAIQLRALNVTHDKFHARHDATQRTYQYHITGKEDPFRPDMVYRFPHLEKLDRDQLQRAASLVLDYDAFFPFCKTNSGVDHYRCAITESTWTDDQGDLTFTISSNRFLRGMVRLIVGMCLNVAIGKLDLAKVKDSLDRQIALSKSWSVPAHGLYLHEIQYDPT